VGILAGRINGHAYGMACHPSVVWLSVFP